MRTVTVLLTILTIVQAQDPPVRTTPRAAESAPDSTPVLDNNGKPISLPFQCTLDDIHWAGLACSEDDPCPIYLELSTVGSAGNDGMFVAGNIHAETVTLYSVLLSSEDAGRTWREAFERVRGTGLDRIQFLDDVTGWISGQTLFPIPQDPFFLLTTDGGKTWRRRPVFDDSHFGSIQQFSFDSKTSGSLIIDQGQGSENARFARYETATGGESWSVREESNKVLQLRTPPSVPVNLRLRTDASAQAFRIEKRQGDRWMTIASFAVRLPICKPE